MVIPLAAIGIIELAVHTGIVRCPNAVFYLVLLLANASPTSINTHTMATVRGNRDTEMGALVFWQYAGALVTMPLFSMLSLALVKRSNLPL